jgi:hypothetical protein
MSQAVTVLGELADLIAQAVAKAVSRTLASAPAPLIL